MAFDTLFLPFLGFAATAWLALLFWNEVNAEREAAPPGTDIYSKVSIRFALKGICIVIGILLEFPVILLILVVVAYAWWPMLAPVAGAAGGSLAIWQIVRWTNRIRDKRRGARPESPPGGS